MTNIKLLIDQINKISKTHQKVYIINLGCYKRSLDETRVKNYFLKNNWQVVTNPSKTDVIFIITCAVGKEMENSSIRKIVELKKYHKKMVVSGCLPGINPNKLSQHFSGITLPVKKLKNINKIFQLKFDLNKIPDGNLIEHPKSTKKISLKKEIYYLRISNGCLGNCSYCGIKNAIGYLESKSLKKCLNEFTIGLNKGYKLFAISGDDVGAYGLDIRLTIVNLIKQILQINKPFKLILQDFHPKWLLAYQKDLTTLFKDKRVVKLNLPIQSGSLRILKLMNREINLEKIKKVIKKIKINNKNIEIHSCLIIGFPSESNKDFQSSVKFVKDVFFDEISLYPFSLRPHTLANKIKKRIPEYVINNRVTRAKKQLLNKNIRVISHLNEFFDKDKRLK